MSAKGHRFYVVYRGRNPGIYNSWDEAKEEVLCFKNNKHESFPTLRQAQEALDAYSSSADSSQTSKDNQFGQSQTSHHVGAHARSGYDFISPTPVQTPCKMSYVA